MIVAEGAYIIAEGTCPICLVAHVDTVFKNKPGSELETKEILYDRVAKVLWSPAGLGADDRAGIYAILQLLNQTDSRPHIIITDKEELGGLGASQLIKDFPECPFNKTKFIIELDREGENDCVFYMCGNEAFSFFIEEYGFHEEIGSFTDISIIAPQWGVAAVNLSVGYKDEHSYLERLYMENLETTIEKVSNILLDSSDAAFFEYVPIKGEFCCLCGKPVPWWGGVKISFLDKDSGQREEDVVCEECYIKAFEQNKTN